MENIVADTVKDSGLSAKGSTGKLAAALAKAQGKMAGAKKDTANPFFRSTYADLASVWEACREPLASNGLSVMQKPSCRFLGPPEGYSWTSKEGKEQHGVHIATEVCVTTVLAHESGEREEGMVSCILADADPQSVGSAITYLRRYGLQSMVGVAPEDDDAETAHGRPKETVTEGPIPACPKCGQKEAVIRDKYKAGGFYCWPNSSKGKGCGKKWGSVAEEAKAEEMPDWAK